MAPPSANDSASSIASEVSSSEDVPDWVGYWRVKKWDGETPAVPTYYVATTDSWDVVKRETDRDSHVAAHPILEIDERTIFLKDEGDADQHAEQWRVEVDEGALRVTALTGPHEGAVGMAERISTDPRRTLPNQTNEDVRE